MDRSYTASSLPPTLIAWLDTISVAAIIEENGTCTWANVAAEDLLGYEAGKLTGRACSDLVAGDALLADREHERLAKDGFWWGDFDLRSATSQPVPIHSIAFSRPGDAGETLFVHLYYPEQQRTYARSAVSRGVSAQSRCLLQLMAEGLTDAELTALLGIVEDDLRALIRDMVRAMGATSRTEAFVKALKSGLVV